MTYSIEDILVTAVQSAAKITSPAARGLAYAQAAEVYRLKGNLPQAQITNNEALKTADMIKYPHEKAKLLASIAAVLAKSGQEGKSKEQFTRATLLARAAESPAQTLEALYRITAEFVEVHYSNEALNLLTAMHKIAAAPESEVDSAAELVSVAELYDDLGEKEQALSVLAEAAAIAESIPDNWFRLERLIEIAECYATCGSPEKAQPLLDIATILAEKIEIYSQPYFMLRLAEVYLILGKKPETWAILQRLPDILKQAETPAENAGGLLDTAEKYLEMEDPTSAQTLLTEALAIAEKILDTRERIILQIEITGWLAEAGQPEQAQTLAIKAYTDVQSLIDKKARIFPWGKLAILWVELKNQVKATEIIDIIIDTVTETSSKTAGLGAIAIELAQEGQFELALKVAELIKEAEAKTAVYIAAASQGPTF